MVGKENPVADSWGLAQISSTRKSFWRSASWSSSRTTPNTENEDNDRVDPNGSIGNNGGLNCRFPVPLTPRSQQNGKGRSCLPPLQPLSIARRSFDEWPKAGSDDIGEWLQPATPSGRADVNGSGERLKLDLSAIQKDPDKNGCGLVKRDKIAFFDKECSKVGEHIYLGGDAVARDIGILRQNRITHVLNCVGFVCPEYFKDDFVYRTLWLKDSPSEDITSILYDVFDYFEEVRGQGGRVFVHCCQGVSRSTSLVIAYLMWREGQSFDDAFQYVKAARGIADPNMGFACQLLQCQKRVHAFPLSPSSLLRMYRIAPHSQYDPLHLVPKTLNDPSPSALDSRGAFIIHIPSAIYIWIGKNCETIMERDARGAVDQIVRYERVQVPIIMISEGDEPAYFWDAFSNLLPLMDKSTSGAESREPLFKISPRERKVDLYDVDFKIFQNAIMGGVVPPFASSETEHETCLPARESSWSVLRRKFASGNMKEFVSSTKLSHSRIFPDSDLVNTKPSYSSAICSSSSSPSSSSASSSSSSSPPYLSPDSLSSDSSGTSKYFSESPQVSPKAFCSLRLSSTMCSSSKFPLLSFKTSPRPKSNSPECNLISQPCSISSPSKRSQLSLAERRGSLSKSLKLPVMTDDTRVIVSSPSSALCQEGNVRMSSNSCSLHDLNNVDNSPESRDSSENGNKESSQQRDLQILSDRVAGANSSSKAAVFSKISDEPRRNYASRESQELSVSGGMRESSSPLCNLMKPLVFRWPGLEETAAFGRIESDPKAAFIIITPETSSGSCEPRVLYFWIGRSFSYNKNLEHLESSREAGEPQERDWNRVGCDILTRMGLSKETTVKIVKEDEEPAEFLALLSSL